MLLKEGCDLARCVKIRDGTQCGVPHAFFSSSKFSLVTKRPHPIEDIVVQGRWKSEPGAVSSLCAVGQAVVHSGQMPFAFPAYGILILGKSTTSQESLAAAALLQKSFKCFLGHGLSFADLK